MGLSLDGWKGLSMVVFTAITVAGAGIAVIMKARAKQIYVTCGVMFSAGVLLAGGYVHMLGDSSTQFEQFHDTGFPWPFAIAGATIVVLACVEIAMERVIGDIVLSVKNKNKNKNNKAGEAGDEEQAIGKSAQASLGTEQLAQGGAGEASHETYQSTQVELSHSVPPVIGAADDDNQSHTSHMYVDSSNPFSAILLTIALSIHVLIEGMGLGAQVNVSAFGTAFIAIAIHKGFVAFALAENMVTGGYWEDRGRRKYFYLSLGIFILMTLVGIAIGWGISGSGQPSVATAVLSAMMSGSFIYVAIMEILPQETKIIKRERLAIIPILFFFVAGYCLMSLLALWA